MIRQYTDEIHLTIGYINSLPYWLSVMHNHGVDFFITPFLGQHQSDTFSGQIEKFLSFEPAGEYLSFIWNWLILAGLIWSTLKRRVTIVGIFFLFWLIPREGLWLVSIPAAILAGCGLVYILFPLFAKTFQTSDGSHPPLAPGILAIILLILVFANTFFNLAVLISEPEWYISQAQIDSLIEFQDEIPKNKSVIIIGNIALAEWAPAILQREVLNIEYGLEWQPDELQKVQDINATIQDGDLAGMISALKSYTGDQQIYLVTSSDDLGKLNEPVPQNARLLLGASTPTLDLYKLKAPSQ